MLEKLKPLFRRPKRNIDLMPESSTVVTFNEEEIKCKRPDGKIEEVRWDDLEIVIVETTDEGPFAPDVFWILIGRDGQSGCVYPGGATGGLEFLREMQERLKDFDNEAVVAAAISTENNKFWIWKADFGSPPAKC